MIFYNIHRKEMQKPKGKRKQLRLKIMKDPEVKREACTYTVDPKFSQQVKLSHRLVVGSPHHRVHAFADHALQVQRHCHLQAEL
jgi:hypothetical protein